MVDRVDVCLERLCGFCKKPVVLKKVKCINCETYFHKSCSIKKTKKCCDKQNFEDDNLQIETQGDMEVLTDSIIEESISRENELLKEINKELKEHVKLLKDKVKCLEIENTNLKENLNGKYESTNIQKEMLEAIKNELTCLLENKFKFLSNEIDNLKFKANEVNVNGNGKKNYVQQKNDKQKPLKPVTPKQIFSTTTNHKSVTPKQGTSDLENIQRNMMNSIIHLTATPGGQNYDENKSESLRDQNTNQDGWQTVARRNKGTFKRHIGESDEHVENFKGIKPKVWLYLYRVSKDVTEDDVKIFIKKKNEIPDDQEIIVKKLTLENTHLNSFMVAADFKYKENFYNPKFWPKGVGYKRFDFKRYNGKNKQQNIDQQKPNSFLEI